MRFDEGDDGGGGGDDDNDADDNNEFNPAATPISNITITSQHDGERNPRQRKRDTASATRRIYFEAVA